VTVHGVLGLWGVLAVGLFAYGYPALGGDPGVITISFVGQLVGAIMMALLGFVPGYVVSLVLKMVGLLRVGEAAEIMGLDPVKVPNIAYPEGIHMNPSR
jgi:Amt family ammonium transporter